MKDTDKLLLKKLSGRIGGSENEALVLLRIRAAIGNSGKHPPTKRIFTAISGMLRDNGYSINERTVVDTLRNKFGGTVTDREIFSVPDCIALSILRSSDTADDGELEKMLNCLRTVDILDVEEIYENTSPLEAYLRASDKYSYNESDRRTKTVIKDHIRRYAGKRRISPVRAAEILDIKEIFGKKRKALGIIYFTSIAVLTSVLFLLSAYVLGKEAVAAAFLLTMPFYELSKQITESVFSRLGINCTLPKLDLKEVPDEGRTMVVITTVLTGGKNDGALIDKLEKYYLGNRDKNIIFGLLADLKDSYDHTASDDVRIAEYAEKRIDALNRKYGESFCLFIRRRCWSKSERKFIGWERKRGAVIELVRYIKRGKTSFSHILCRPESVRSVRYIFTLDSDTELYIGSVKEALGAMLHPSNKIAVSDGIVTEGHAVLQPRMDASLGSASKTVFAAMRAGSGGIDMYSSAAYDTYQGVFGEGIYCGKGLFSVDAFYDTVDRAFPDNCILSHDILEGARLNAASASDIILTDSLPSTALSEYRRLHRWIRGDIQALPFAKKYIRVSNGKTVKNPISGLSKYKIIDNARRALLPVFTVAAMLTGLCAPGIVPELCVLFALSYILYPAAVNTVRTAGSAAGRFFSLAFTAVSRGLLNCVFDVMAIFQSAYISADAVIRSLYRMKISGRKLLEWKTHSESEKSGNSLKENLIFMLPSIIAGAAALILIPRVTWKIIGAAWFLLPFVSYRLGIPRTGTKKITAEQVNVLTGYCRDMWRYFSDNAAVRDNYLPPDNIQFKPFEKTAHRTSPTNIGLYLVSALCAYRFGFIDINDLRGRIGDTVSTIVSLKKFRGHLYNWYDTETLEIIGDRFISTVDSGNFVCSLIALKEGLISLAGREPSLLDLLPEIEKIITDTDFTFLYNKRRRLFSIGYDTELGKLLPNCYDIMMTECRLAGYWAVASGQVPREHWSAPARLLVKKRGYTGMLSWNGTAFEYFMPSLFAAPKKNSLEWESLNFAYMMQTSVRYDGLWGKSESSYNEHDSDGNYKYLAIGIQSLGVERKLDRNKVISPYSSFLCLPVSVEGVLENLERIKEKGGYGRYGFREAIDMTPGRKGAVDSHMSHHIGMSIIACANACLDGYIQKLFMSRPQTGAADELLSEKLPLSPVFAENKYVGIRPARRFFAKNENAY